MLIITGDADVMTLEHSVALFRLLGGGIMGDMGEPLPARGGRVRIVSWGPHAPG